MNLFLIPFLIFLSSLIYSKDAKAYFTYKDEAEFDHPKILEGTEDIIFECPQGITRAFTVWSRDFLTQGGYFQYLEQGFYGYPYVLPLAVPNLRKGWDFIVSPTWNYNKVRVESIASSLFFVPLKKEVYVNSDEDFVKVYMRRLLKGSLKKTKNSFTLKEIGFMAHPNCTRKFRNCPKEYGVFKFKNSSNKEVFLIDNYEEARKGDFWLMNSKNQFFKGLNFANPADTLICSGNNLIVRNTNSFRLNTRDDLGNEIRGPLIIILREVTYKLQKRDRNYVEPSL